MKYFQFKLPIFDHNFKVVVGGSFEEALALFRKKGLPCSEGDLGGEVEGATWGAGTDVAIWVDAKLEHLLHEAFHATSHVLRHVGVSLTPESEETYAYLQDYLVREIKTRSQQK